MTAMRDPRWKPLFTVAVLLAGIVLSAFGLVPPAHARVISRLCIAIAVVAALAALWLKAKQYADRLAREAQRRRLAGRGIQR